MNNQLSGHIQVIFATLIIAGSFIATEEIAAQLHTISLNLMRFVIAALVFAPFVLSKKENWLKLIRVLPRSLVISFFFCSYFACNFIAMLTTSSLNVGSIYTLTPFITALMSIFFFKQKLSISNIAVYLLGIVGTIWVIFKGDLTLLAQFELNNGDLIFSLGVVCMSCYTIAMKMLYRGDDVKVMTLSNLIGGIIWMFMAALVTGISLDWQSLKPQYYPSMLYLAIAATFVTSFLYQKASTILRPVNISAYIYLNPLCVAVLTIVMFGEFPDWIIWVGIIISATATCTLQLLERKR